MAIGQRSGKAFDSAIERYSAFLDRDKGPLFLLMLLFIAFMATQAVRIEADGSQDAFFYDDDPVVMRNDLIDANFDSADAMTVFLRLDKASTQSDRVMAIDDPRVLEYVAAIEGKLLEKGFVDTVVGPDTNPYFFNKQGGSALVLIYMDLGEGDKELQERKGQIEEIVELTGRPTGLAVSVGGAATIFSEVSRLLFQDLIKTGLVSLMIIALCVRAFYGSNSMTLINVFILAAIMISVFGTMHLLGVPLNIATALIAVLTIGIGVDYTLHLQNSFMEGNGARVDVLGSTLRRIGPPLSMAFLTTVIGFLSLFFAGSKVMETLAVSTSIGIFYIFLFNMTLTPLVFLLWGMDKVSASGRRPQSAMAKALRKRLPDLSGMLGKRTWLSLGIMGLVIASMAAGLSLIDTKTDYSGFIPADNPVIVDITEQSDAFPGSISNVNVIIEADDVLDQHVLEVVDGFEKRVSTLEHVESVSSPVDRIKAMNDGQIPETRARLEGDPDIGNDYKMMRINIGYGGLAASDDDVLLQELLPEVMDSFPPGYDMYFAGEAAFSVHEREVMGQGQGAVALFSFALIFIILVLYFRSVPIGIMMLVPIALAVVSTMGLSGWTGVPFSQITSSIFGIIIGIGMDFAIHTGSEMRRHLDQGQTYEGAVEATHEHLAKLLYLTSLTTVLGFLALQLADLRFLRDLGVTLAFGILFAFLYSLILLPALIVAYYRIRRALGARGGSGSL